MVRWKCATAGPLPYLLADARAARPSARLPPEHGGRLGPSVAPSCNSSQSSHPVGIVGICGLIGGPRGAAGGQPRVTWGEPGVSGLLWRVNNQATTCPPPASPWRRLPHPSPDHLPPQSQPLSNPRVPALHTGTRPPKPLGITGCPAGHWTNKATLDTAGPTAGPPGPPQGGVPEPRRVCVSHSHFWAKIVTLSSPTVHPNFPQVHHYPPPSSPPSTYDAHLVNRSEQRLRKGVHRVSGCWSLCAGVSRSKTIGDYK